MEMELRGALLPNATACMHVKLRKPCADCRKARKPAAESQEGSQGFNVLD